MIETLIFKKKKRVEKNKVVLGTDYMESKQGKVSAKNCFSQLVI